MIDVELLPQGYRAVCAVCGADCKADEYPEGVRPFLSTTIGLDEKTACVATIVSVCPTHAMDSKLDAFAIARRYYTTQHQITAALGQWNLPDGSMTPVFVFGVVVQDDGSKLAQIVAVDAEQVKNPLHVPIEQVVVYQSPPSATDG